MDQEAGPSKSTPKKSRKPTKEDKINLLYKKFRNIRLTPSKFPGMIDELSDIEADVEGEEQDTDFDSDSSDIDTADDGESMVEESEEEEVGLPQPPPRRRAGRPHSTFPDAVWCTDNTPPSVERFTGTPGLRIPTPTTPIQFVQLFFTRALIEYLTIETNLYAKQFLQNASSTAVSLWRDVTVKEMARYLGLSMLMGIARLPTMRMYWQTSRVWHMRTFNTFMTSKRFENIGQFFHSYNNKSIPPNNKDRMIKLRPVMKYLIEKFSDVYTPKKELSLDEGTMSWRGRLSFKVYNPNKPDKYGIKLYMLAEARSGYICDFEVYAGIGKTTVETVMGLIHPLMHQGYHLYMDNYYNSVNLTEQLRQFGVYTCGTIRLQRGAPKALQQQAKGTFPVDRTIFNRKDNTFIILWKDKRVVSLITNCHNADTQEVERRKRVRNPNGTSSVRLVTVNKPKAICDYNTNMKGVDHFDQMVKYYRFTRKSHKWTKKITFYFLQMAIHNAYVVYKNYSSDQKKMTLLQFHEVAIWFLLRWDNDEWPNTDNPIPHAPDINADDANVDRPGPSGVRRPLFTSTPKEHNHASDSEPEAENSEPPTTSDHPPPKKRPRIVDPETRLNKNLTHAIVKLARYRRCRVCYKSGKRKETKHQCKTCGVALCPTPCYTKYHRKRVFWVVPK